MLPVAIILLAGLLIYAGTHDMSVTDVFNKALGRPVQGGDLSSLDPNIGTAIGQAAGSLTAASTGGTGSAKGGLANPFPLGWIPNRLDMGYDGTFKGKIVSPVNGVVTYASNAFSNWGGWVEVRASAPIPGLPSQTFYFAEGLQPTVRTGQQVTAGQQIATPAASPFGNPYGTGGQGEIEWGLGQMGNVGSPTDPLAKAVSNPAAMVLAFAAWAEKELGVSKPSQTSHAGLA